MRCKSLVLATTVALGRLAAAQPTPSEPPAPEPAPEPAPPPAPAPAPTPPPPPPPPPVVHHEAVAEDGGIRPVGWAFGIGIGYALPTSLETPNTASVRFRLPSGLTLEPRVAVASSSTTMSDTTPGAMATTDTTSQFLVSTAVRKPVVEHGRYDFELIGAAVLDVTKKDPNGDNNTRTDSTIGLAWGIAVGAWITQHWQVSFGVTNPLITYTSTKQETGPGTSMTTSTTDIGIVFDPNVVMMIHLYD